MFRDKELENMFSKTITGDYEKNILEKTNFLVKFAYKYKHETKKDKTKGVAFVREVLDSNEDKIKNEVSDYPILTLAKLYKVGLQANAGWGSRLPGKEIREYALDALSKIIERNGPDMCKLIAYLYDGNIPDEKLKQDSLFGNNRFLPKDVDDTQKKLIIQKFKKDIKSLNVSNVKNNLKNWYQEKIYKTKVKMDDYLSKKGMRADLKNEQNEELNRRLAERIHVDWSTNKIVISS